MTKSMIGIGIGVVLVVALLGWAGLKMKAQDAHELVYNSIVSIEEHMRIIQGQIDSLEPILKSTYVKMRLNEDRAQEAAERAARTEAVAEKAKGEIGRLATKTEQARKANEKVVKVGDREHSVDDVLDDLNVRLDDFEQLEARLTHEQAIARNVRATYENSESTYESMKARRLEMIRELERTRAKLASVKSLPRSVVDRESQRFSKVEKSIEQLAARIKKAGLESEWADEVVKQRSAEERIRAEGYGTSFGKTNPRDALARARALFGEGNDNG